MLHCDVHGGGVGSGRVVLVHGFTQTREVWGPITAALSAAHQVVAVDAPGHGGSSHIRAGLVEAAHLLGDAGGPAAYVGYSMGGRIALQLAAAQPELVWRLVLVGATPGIEDDDERSSRRSEDERLAAEVERDGLDTFLERWLSNPLFTTLPREAAGLDARRDNTAEGLASSLRSMGTGSQVPLWHLLPSLRMPALFVVGELDAKFSAIAARMAAAWGGDARVHAIPGAGHAAHLERPDAFLDAVLPFLAAGHPDATPAARSSP